MLALPMTALTQSKSEQAEKESVIRAALDYAEGYYEGNADRMDRALDPVLIKRGLMPTQSGGRFLVQMNAQMLIEATRSGRGKLDPKDRNIDAAVLDIGPTTASAKIFTARFNDFLHLVKRNGQWRIANVLWQPPVPASTTTLEGEKPSIEKAMDMLKKGADEKNVEMAAAAIHPEIAKRTYYAPAPGGPMTISELNGEMIRELVRMGRAAPPNPVESEVTVLDVYDHIASVKVKRGEMVDYLHLAMQDGTWRIVNGLAAR